jgi:hypothetical protein
MVAATDDGTNGAGAAVMVQGAAQRRDQLTSNREAFREWRLS